MSTSHSMSNARNGATGAFRPTRSTRSTATAATASSSARTAGAAPPPPTTTTTTRSRSTSRPPSTTSNGRPGSSAGPNGPSRPGSVAGFSAGTTRSSSALNAGRASAPAGPSAGTTAGVKRRTRTASSDADQEPTAAKRPALSSAFSAHVTQSSLNRQLLAAQAQVTELQNKLLEKQRDIDRLEADLRIVGTREEEEREARKQSDEELAQKTRIYETEVARLRKRLAELEADHEDLDDAYSNLSHSSQSKINALTLEIQTRDERIGLLETQLSEAEARVRDEEIRAKALEELLEQITEEGSEYEGEGEAEMKEEKGGEHKDIHEKDGELKTDARPALEFKEPESSVDDKGSMNDEAEDEDPDADGDVDADGEVDPEESASMIVDTDRDATPTRDVESSSGPSAEPHTFYEGGQPEIEAYPDPGAPPPYTATSPASESASTVSHTRSASIASSHNTSMGSSQAMSFTGPAPPSGAQRSPSVASISVVSSSHLDPLSHIRRRLSLATPSRRRRSSVGPSRERGKNNEIIRTELARQTSHVATLEAANARLTNELTRLRTRAEGAEVLREEKREFERRVESMEALRVRVAELETSTEEFARREREWEAKLRERAQQVGDENNMPAKTPVGVTQQLMTLRKAHATLLDEHGQLKASLRACEIELTSAREEAENATSEVGRLREEVEHLQDAIARKEKERVLLERDATFLRSLVTSYKNEEASFTVSDDGEHSVATEKLEQRIVQLETLLTEYKSTIESLEAEVDRLRRTSSTTANKSQQQWDQLSNKASTLEEAFNDARAEATRQAQCVEELEQRLFVLGGEIGGGRHIPPATRVLSLRHNPAQEWADTRKEVLDRLKAENEALLARLKELEDQGLRGSTTVSSDPDDDKDKSLFVPRESWVSLKQETEEQKTLLAQKEKRLLRLQQVYTAKSAEFREAIESILGLKLAFYPNGQVRVTSVYDLTAAFVFQPSKDKEKVPGKEGEEGVKMQLVAAGERVPEELEGLMNLWIRDEMCIPCFMSSVTLECYDRWKNEQRQAGLAS